MRVKRIQNGELRLLGAIAFGLARKAAFFERKSDVDKPSESLLFTGLRRAEILAKL